MTTDNREERRKVATQPEFELHNIATLIGCPGTVRNNRTRSIAKK